MCIQTDSLQIRSARHIPSRSQHKDFPNAKQGFKEGDFQRGQPQRGRSPICGSPFDPVPEARTAQTIASEKQTRHEKSLL